MNRLHTARSCTSYMYVLCMVFVFVRSFVRVSHSLSDRSRDTSAQNVRAFNPFRQMFCEIKVTESLFLPERVVTQGGARRADASEIRDFTKTDS